MPDDIAGIQDEVWGAADPTGETRALVDAAVHGGDEIPVWLRRIVVDVDETWAQLTSVGLEFRRSVEGIVGAFVVLVPRGWAPANMDSETVFRAVDLTIAGLGGQADEVLAGQWEGEGAWRLKRVCQRVGVMGASDHELSHLFKERARLLGLAMDHHLAGRFDASIPLLQAQLEGIVMDVTGGKKFFTKGRAKADLVDPRQLVSIEAGLAALQVTFGQDVQETQTKGSLSRHGVAHGRELAYDTRVNSAKTWSVVDALVEWALPKARDLVDAHRAERQARNAGSQETDERGRRIDDREVAQTRDALHLLEISAMGWYRQRGAFPDDLVSGVHAEEDFTRRGLPEQHGICQLVRPDGGEVAYWRRTASGWVLGLALAGRDDGFGEYLYAAPRPPDGLPSQGAEGWGLEGETPPDWA